MCLALSESAGMSPASESGHVNTMGLSCVASQGTPRAFSMSASNCRQEGDSDAERAQGNSLMTARCSFTGI